MCEYKINMLLTGTSRVNSNLSFSNLDVCEKEWVQTVHWRVERIHLCIYVDNVDNLLLWGTTENEKIMKEIQECYDLISSDEDLKLFKPRYLSEVQ